METAHSLAKIDVTTSLAKLAAETVSVASVCLPYHLMVFPLRAGASQALLVTQCLLCKVVSILWCSANRRLALSGMTAIWTMAPCYG